MNKVAFEKGQVGFYRNKKNPYPPQSYMSKEWERGWNSAYFDNKEKVIQRETRRGS